MMPATTDVIILCGGRGTRLGALSLSTPKPLLPVGGEPFALHLIRRLAGEGFGRVVLAAHYLAVQFYDFVLAHQGVAQELELLVEPQPLGTGGALRFAAEAVRSETFVALNGDTWMTQPLAPVLEEHARAGRDCTAVVTPAARVEGGASGKGVWDIGADQQVRGFATPDVVSSGWVNAGVYVLGRSLVRSWPSGGPYSLEAEAPRLLRGARAGLFYSDTRLLDIGTPESYARAAHELTAFASTGVRP